MSKIPRVGDLYDPSFEGMEPHSIKSVLGGVAYDIAEDTYTRPLTAEELQDKREIFVDLNIDVAEIQKEIKDFTDSRKVIIKEKSKEMAIVIGDVKTKTTTVTGTIFNIDDQENGLMLTYDATGTCIDVRALKAKEKQTKIFSIKDNSKNGTDGE